MTTSSTVETLNAIIHAGTYGSEVLCANPYNGFTLPYFYFSSADEYEEKLEAAKELDLILNGCGDFEHELMFIDGEGSQSLVDDADSVEAYFELVDKLESMEEYQQAAFHSLQNHFGYNITEAMEKLDEVSISEGSPVDYAWEMAEDMGIEGFAMTYFDAERFARDLELNGEIMEIRFNGTRYIMTNFN